jgi:hypothetical protein
LFTEDGLPRGWKGAGSSAPEIEPVWRYQTKVVTVGFWAGLSKSLHS